MDNSLTVAVFTIKNLERSPTKGWDLRQTLASQIVGDNSSQNEQEAADAMREVKGILQRKRIHPDMYFYDFDVHHVGRISEQQFRQAMQSAFSLTGPTVEALILKYRTQGGDVSFRRFLLELARDDESTENQRFENGDGERAQTESTANGSLPPSTTDALARISAYVQERRLRIYDSLSEFDRLRTGLIPRGQVTATFSRLGCYMSELEQCVDEFTTSDGRVRYRDLVAAIESTQPAPARDSVNEEALDAARPIVDKISGIVTARNILLMPFFRDIDVLRRSRVTPAQFKRTLSQLAIYLTDHELSLLTRAYADRGDIRYDSFVNDVDQWHPPSITASTAPRAMAQVKQSSSSQIGIEDVLDRLRTLVQQQRIRVSEFLRDYDRSRTGVIRASQFRSGLNAAKISVSDSEFAALCERFGTDKMFPDGILWQAFADVVHDTDEMKDIEKSPTKPIKIATQTVTRGSSSLKQVDDTTAAALEHAAQWIYNRQLDLLPVFLDYDRLRTGRVAPSRLTQVLTAQRTTLRPDELQLIRNRYTDERTGTASYRSFLSDMSECMY